MTDSTSENRPRKAGEQREARRALADSEALLSAIIENAPAGIMVRDLDGRYIRGNAYAAETLGLSQEEIAGRHPDEFFSPEAVRAIRAHDEAVIRTGEPVSEELTVTRATGERLTYQTIKYPIRDGDGTIVGLGSFSLDITEHKLTERELRKSEQRLRDAQALARFGSWELDLGSGLLDWSEELWRIVGREPGPAPTYEEFIALIHPDDRDGVMRRVNDARDGTFTASDYRIVRPDGEIRHVHTRRFGRFDEDGTLIELWGTTQDVTERVIAEEELRSARERSQAIIAGMREGYALTVDGEIREVNEALCALTGFSREELIGAHTPFPFWPPQLLEQTLALRDTVIEQEGGTFEVTLIRKDGSLFDGEITAQPARRRDGSVLGFVSTLRDISAAKRHRTELEREREALREAQHLAHVGSWDYDVANMRPGRWSAELWRMLELEPQPVAPPLDRFIAMIHPDDRERIAARITRALADMEPFADEFAMLTASGRELHVAFRAESILDDAGRPISAYGTLQDITERADREREEVAVRKIAQLVARGAGPAAVFEEVAREICALFGGHVGAIARFDEQSRRAVQVTGITGDGETLPEVAFDLDGSSAAAAVHRTGRPSRAEIPVPNDDPAMADAMAQGVSGAVAAPITVAGRAWGCLGVSFAGRPVPPGAEQRLGRLAELVGMAIANTEAWDALSRAATTDALTGLANRRAFEERLRNEWTRARRYGRDLSLVLIDLDRFKEINDTFGHQVGDQVLAELGRRLERHVRDEEFIARIGGEEFAWLLPEADGEAAHHAAERLRRSIRSTPFDDVGAVTISAGVCAADEGLDHDDLIRLADGALYRAKESGRDATRVHVAGEQTTN